MRVCGPARTGHEIALTLTSLSFLTLSLSPFPSPHRDLWGSGNRGLFAPVPHAQHKALGWFLPSGELVLGSCLQLLVGVWRAQLEPRHGDQSCDPSPRLNQDDCCHSPACLGCRTRLQLKANQQAHPLCTRSRGCLSGCLSPSTAQTKNHMHEKTELVG